MPKSTFEKIENKDTPSFNAFVTSIESSSYHWHYQYEILMVLRGSLRLHTDNQEFDLKAQDLVIVNSRSIHAITGEAGNLAGLIQLHPSLFDQEKEEKRQFRFFLNTTDPEEADGAEQVRQRAARILLNSLSDDKISFYRLRAEVCGLVADLVEQTDYDVILHPWNNPAEQDEIYAIIDFVRDHIREADLTDLTARQFGLSGKTLYRTFQSSLGVSFKEFSDELRVEEAKRYLRETDKSLGYIMDNSGFFSEKTFYRVFQKITGQTPGSYRKHVLEDTDDPAKVRGYLDYEPYEAKQILKDLLGK